ncbi:hypothetical protein BM1_09446 [Bipolaris maydis]|nr:hypothetical protein BM1_09446 [Bipolaris maydis]
MYPDKRDLMDRPVEIYAQQRFLVVSSRLLLLGFDGEGKAAFSRIQEHRKTALANAWDYARK